MKTALILFADGSEELEAVTVINILRRAGVTVVFAGLHEGPLRGSRGTVLVPDTALDDVLERDYDMVVLPGGQPGTNNLKADERVLKLVRRMFEAGKYVTAICAAPSVLATAGLLDGKRATAHWACGHTLSERYPSVRVEPDRIFVRDGSVLTSAGVTAGMDLALALVEEDHGPEVARIVARWLVMFVQRPGGQSQFSERLAIPLPLGSPIRALLDDIVAHPSADHRVPELARRAALSERHLARVFAEQTQMTPARFVERVRVEAARTLLETSDMPVDSVAHRIGFGSDETMRRAFLRVLGVGPAAYRERFARVAA